MNLANKFFENRLIVDTQSIDDLIQRVIGEVRQLRADSFVARILQDEDIDDIRKWEDLVSERGNQPFSLVIIGDFKRGKSTLINALLGKATVTTNATPETVTINRVKYGVTPRIEAVLTNGMRVHLEQNELSREVIESLTKNFPAAIDHIDIIENNELLRDICITDTPGLGDVLKCFDQRVRDYIVNADAIIYVVSALSPLSESEQLFLSTILSQQHFSRLFVVINYADCLENETEIAKIADLVLERARAISSSSVVYTISALEEFNRKTGRKSPNPDLKSYLDIAFQRFENMLQNDLLLNKDVIRAERVVILLKTMVKSIRGKITAFCSLLTEQVDHLAEEEQNRNNDLANINDRLRASQKVLNDLAASLFLVGESWMREYLIRLKTELRTLDNLPSQDLQKHLQFYLMDMIRDASARCIKTHRHLIEEEIHNQLMLLSNDSLTPLKTEDIIVDIELSDISWTKADSLTNYCGHFFGEVGELIVGGLTGFWREATIKKSSGKIIEALLEDFLNIENACMVQLHKMYDQLAEQANKRIEEVYATHIHNSLNALKRAQEILRMESIKKEDMNSKLSMAMSILDRAEQIVDQSGFINPEKE